MNCSDLTNDQLMAPSAEVSAHLAACADCRERQKTVHLTVRALRALADDFPFPDRNDAAIRAAIPRIAQESSRRRPSGWWQTAAAAALLLAAGATGAFYASHRMTQRVNSLPPREPVTVGTKETPAVDPMEVKDPEPDRPEVAVNPEPPPPVPPDVVKPEPEKDPVVTEKPPPPEVPEKEVTAGGEKPPQPPDPGPGPGPEPEPASVSVTVADCRRVMSGVVGADEPAALDLNGDGKTDVADALLAARAVAESGGRR